MVLRQRVRRFGIVDMFGGLQCRVVMSNAHPFKKTQSKLGFADAPLSDQQQLDLGQRSLSGRLFVLAIPRHYCGGIG